MTPRYETINGTICRMVEPTPLTPEATFPCVVRLIQDDSPMGRYNQAYSEYRYGVKLGCCMLPLIATHIDKNGVVNDTEWDMNRYEIIGYPVAEGSAEWALYQQKQGHVLSNPRHNLFRQTFSSDDTAWDCISIYPDGWITEPKPLLADAQVGDLCKLRNGAWTQIEHIYTICYPKRFRALNGWSYSIDGKAGDPAYNVNDDYDIIHTELLATDGTGEWAWQMLMLQKPVSHPAEGEFQDTYYTKEGFVRCMAKTGWQLYEPKPQPQYKVGDWVEYGEKQYKLTGIPILYPDNFYSVLANGNRENIPKADITRKLDRSEVKVKIGCLEGTVRRINYIFFCLCPSTAKGWVVPEATIPFAMLDPATRSLVKNLLKEEGDK